MSSLEQTIISTLAYYRALGVFCLTPLEIRRYWFDPLEKPALNALLGGLVNLRERNTLTERNGYWALATTPPASQASPPAEQSEAARARALRAGEGNFFEARVRGQKIAIQKQHIFEGPGRFFPYIPFVRGVALVGSVARQNASSESDIDVCVVTAPGWLWTTRMLVTLFTHMTGKRRHHANVRDRICLNYYIAQDGLQSEPQNRPLYHIHAQALPVWGIEAFNTTSAHSPFIGQKEWGRTYIPAPTFRPAPVGRMGTLMAEGILRIIGAEWFEALAQKIQTIHIARTLERGGEGDMRITSYALVFHQSRDAYVERTYEKIMGAFIK